MTEEITTRGERTRAEILQAASSLFIQHGFHGTSMRQIAEQAGIALGGIYNHFSSKEDIFTAVVIEYHPLWEVFPMMNAAQGETVEEFVNNAAQLMVNQFGGRTDFLNLMFIELVEFHSQHFPQFSQMIYPQIKQFAERFRSERQELREIPLLTVARAFVGLFFSYVMTDIFIGKQLPAKDREKALGDFIDIYLKGILKNCTPEEVAP
jgi:AcrR family transcriptional regulator